MRLSAWIMANGGRVTAAKKIGVPYHVLRDWHLGINAPKLKDIPKIIKATAGAVMHEDLISLAISVDRKRSKKRGKRS